MSALPELVEEKIEYMLENFNFERVCLVMQTLDWKWAQPDGTHKIPNIQQIKVRARHMLEDAYRDLNKPAHSETTSIGTQCGGLEATCYRTEDENEYDFLLKFVLTQTDTDDYTD